MANLIKMDMRRLFRSPFFIIAVSVVAVFNILSTVAMTLLSNMFSADQTVTQEVLSHAVSAPFYLSLLSILMFVSLISFSYADFAGGYIKNLAGQLPHKSSLIFSKFAVIGVHNLIFIAVGSASNVLANLTMSATGMLRITDDGKLGAAFLTLLLKWLVSMAIAAILLFITNGVRNKILATVVGVILGTGALGLAYFGLNTAVANIFHTEGFDLNMYMPDSLMNNVNVGANIAVVNAIVVSLVCIVLFTVLTVKVFKSRDIK